MLTNESFNIIFEEIQDDKLEVVVFSYVDDELFIQGNEEIGSKITECLNYFMNKDYLVRSIRLSAGDTLKIECTRVLQ